MRSQRRVIDAATIEMATGTARHRLQHAIEYARRIQEDPDRPKRHAKGECPACYYSGGRMAGQAFTQRQCGLCDAVILHSNTAVPVLCGPCADKHGLCRNCGGDREMKSRRKPRELGGRAPDVPPEGADFEFREVY